MRTPRSRVSANLTHAMGWFTWGGGRIGEEKGDIAFPWLDPWSVPSSWNNF